MAISYETEVLSQNSIYNKSKSDIKNNRKLKVYFSVPEKGTDKNTGLLLFIAGFGGKSISKVYKKMRDKFADKYNLVTIQCDYFGYEFMQSSDKLTIPNIDRDKLIGTFTKKEIEEIYQNSTMDSDKFIDIGSKYNINIEINVNLLEDINNFNDMGIIQALDNITAVLNVMNILYDNEYCFNSKKAIIYGHSHGAYLAYLCNAFSPSLFSLIIDNSAWLYPAYLQKDIIRYRYNKIGKLIVTENFDYLAKKIIDDKEILDLNILYSKFKNNCSIISYHGNTDNLVSCNEKRKFCEKVNKCTYIEVSEDKIDNVVFKSTNHGLNSDFIEMFDYTMNKFNVNFEKGTQLDLQNEVSFKTFKHKYVINYENIIPKIQIL